MAPEAPSAPPLIALTNKACLHYPPRSPPLTLASPTPATTHFLPDGALLTALPDGSVHYLPPSPSAATAVSALSSSSSSASASVPTSTVLLGACPTPASHLAASSSALVVARGTLLSAYALPSGTLTASFSLPSTPVALTLQRGGGAVAVATKHALQLHALPSARLLLRHAAPPPSARPASFTAPPSPSYTAAAFSPHHPHLLATADDAGVVTIHDTVARPARTDPSLRTARTHAVFASPLRAPTAALAFAAAATAPLALVAAGFDKTLRFFDPALRSQLLSLPVVSPVSAVALSPEAAYVAVGFTTGVIHLLHLTFPVRTAAILKELRLGETPVRELHLRPPPTPRRRLARAPVMRDVRAVLAVSPSAVKTPRACTAPPPADDDLFSPVNPAHAADEVTVHKSSSFHSSPTPPPRTPTPRSSTIHDIAAGTVGVFTPLQPANDPIDSDSVDSLTPGRTPPTDVVLQGSTVSEGIARMSVGGNQCRASSARQLVGQDARAPSEPALGSAKAMDSGSGVTIPVPQAGNSSSVAFRSKAASSLANYRRVSAQGVRRNSDDLTGRVGAKKRDVDFGSFNSPGDAQFSDASSRSLHRSQHSGSPRDSPGEVGMQAPKGVGGIEDVGSGWVAALAEKLRGSLSQELELSRAELRRDILNIHTDIVVISAKHSEELEAAFEARDRRVKQLEDEVNQLKADNERLRVKYGLG